MTKFSYELEQDVAGLQRNIERLTAEKEGLRAALANLADAYYRNCDSGPDERYSPQEDREYRDALVLLNQQQTPQSFVEAKKERDDGWPGEF